MPNIIIKNYEHVNRSFAHWDTVGGVHVKNKDHYDRLMKEQDMVSYETMQQQAEGKKLKEYNLSAKARAIIEAAKASKDKKGRVKLSDRTIDAMKETGAIGKEIPSYMQLPKHYQK